MHNLYTYIIYTHKIAVIITYTNSYSKQNEIYIYIYIYISARTYKVNKKL